MVSQVSLYVFIFAEFYSYSTLIHGSCSAAPPKVIFSTPSPKRVNETNNATMKCGVSGVPTPSVSWTKDGGSKVLFVGEVYTIPNVKKSNEGKYKCTADNEKGSDDKEIDLIVQGMWKRTP